MDKKKLVLNHLKQHRLCVLATTDGERPEAATIYFFVTDRLEIIFETLKTNRKVRNLSSNRNVAISVGGKRFKNVQYEGTAKRIDPEEFSKKYRDKLKARMLPKDRRRNWVSQKDVLFFKISPKWIRYYDSNKEPIYRFEIRF